MSICRSTSENTSFWGIVLQLLAGSESGCPGGCPTHAVLASVAGASSATRAVIVMTGTPCPAGMFPGRVQVVTCSTFEHVQPAPTADTKVRPTGSVSVTVIGPCANAVPMLVTVRSNVASAPRTSRLVLTFSISRSGEMMCTVAVSVSFVRCVSEAMLADVTVAVLT